MRHVDATTLAVTDPEERAPATQANEWTTPAVTTPASGPATGNETGISIAADNGGMIGSLLKDGGVAMVLASFMLFGVLLAFTPDTRIALIAGLAWLVIMTAVFFTFVRGKGRERTVLPDDAAAAVDPAATGSR